MWRNRRSNCFFEHHKSLLCVYLIISSYKSFRMYANVYNNNIITINQGGTAYMTNDKVKDQIPLFEMPELKKEHKPESDSKSKSRAAKNAPAKEDKHYAAPRKSSADATTPSKQRKAKNSAAMVGIKESLSGQVPEGDVRLTANIRDDLHLKLKITAARRRTTIGELIEELVDKYL
jgi:hypothetical protein